MLSVQPSHCPMFTKRVVPLCNVLPRDVSAKISRLSCDQSDLALHAASIQALFRAFKARAIYAVFKAANDDGTWGYIGGLFDATSIGHFRDLCIRLVIDLDIWQWTPLNTLCVFTTNVTRCRWSQVKSSTETHVRLFHDADILLEGALAQNTLSFFLDS